MGIPENQLEIWSRLGSVTQSASTYASIKTVLESKDSPYSGQVFQVFLQGSYGNDTNVYSESDVDVVIRLDSVFYYDLSQLDQAGKEAFSKDHPDGTYDLPKFKTSVTAWLVQKFGKDVVPGTKAIFIKGNGGRRDADVLVCAKLRKYVSYGAGFTGYYIEGIRFWRSDGTMIDNFPKQHSENLTQKHQATSWLKPTVRIFKNMRNRMVADGLLKDGVAPSYFVEGLLYNASNACFGTSYADTVVACINFLNSADRTNYVCANEQYYLLRDGSPVTWNAADCNTFLAAVIKFWNNYGTS